MDIFLGLSLIHIWLAKQAEKFHRPVICFIDTPGAYCGIAAEERGQGEAIARNLYEFMGIKTPIISIVLGEGGSGGADVYKRQLHGWADRRAGE